MPRSGRWRTTFKHKSHRYCLGTFSTADEAARVWDLAAIKSRPADFGGLNFSRDTYACEIELLDKYSLEETLHMLKVKLIDAKRSGRAVKRKLDSALDEEKAQTGGALAEPASPSMGCLSRGAARVAGATSPSQTTMSAPANTISKPQLVAKRSQLVGPRGGEAEPDRGNAQLDSAPSPIDSGAVRRLAEARCAHHVIN